MAVEIALPASKSIRQRMLVMAAVARRPLPPLSDGESDDVRRLHEALTAIEGRSGGDRALPLTLDAHQSATALRLLAAYCAAIPGRFVITGDERLCRRPVGPLVETLRRMGADISYLAGEGCAPLLVDGRALAGGRARIDASVSSQFLTALLLVEPLMRRPLEIEAVGRGVSSSYLRLTKEMVARPYDGALWHEADWSAALVFFSAVAILRRGGVMLRGLSPASPQPDRSMASLFRSFGVEAAGEEGGVRLGYRPQSDRHLRRLDISMSDNPDAVMAIVPMLLMRGVRFRLSGLATLRVKESDRLAAICETGARCGYLLSVEDDTLIWEGGTLDTGVNPPVLSTYNDHRMAMMAALLSLRRTLLVEGREVVGKSFPGFWTEFDKIGKLNNKTI